MIFEIYEADKEFIINLLKGTHLTRLMKNIRSANVHPECDEFVTVELTKYDAEELAGQLSFEANHSRNKTTSERACEIAESIEIQLSSWRSG